MERTVCEQNMKSSESWSDLDEMDIVSSPSDRGHIQSIGESMKTADNDCDPSGDEIMDMDSLSEGSVDKETSSVTSGGYDVEHVSTNDGCQQFTGYEDLMPKNISDQSKDQGKHTKRKHSKHSTSQEDLEFNEQVVSDNDSSSDKPEELEKESEEDDMKSKLLNIHVLPRIPRRKPVTHDEGSSPEDGKPSYGSVLERVDVTPSQGRNLHPKWSAAGWQSSSTDKPAPKWNSSNRKSGGNCFRDVTKRVNRSRPAESHNEDNHLDRRRLMDEVKPTPPKFWSSPATPEASVAVTFDEKELSPKTGPLPTNGPLPTLPVEEQMRARARLRTLQMLGCGDALGNVSTSDSGTPSGLQASSSDNSPYDPADRNNFKVTFDHVAHTEVSHCSEMKNNKVLFPQHVRDGQPSSSSAGLSKEDRSHRSYRSESKVDKKHHSYSETKNKPAHDQTVKNVTYSPPRPQLPVLPLFASFCAADSLAEKANLSKAKWTNEHPTPISLLVVPSHVHSSEPKGGVSLYPISNGLPVAGDASSILVGTSKSADAHGGSSHRVVSKSVTFRSPERSDNSSDGGKKTKANKKSEPGCTSRKLKYEDKLSLQMKVIEEMKTFLKPYYTGHQISKEQYKDIMRHAVPRICHGQPSRGDISTSRIHKYAKSFVEKLITSSRDGSKPLV